MPAGSAVPILTQPDIRRFVRKLLELELPEQRVLSFAELLPEIAVKPVARATVVRYEPGMNVRSLIDP